MTWVLVSCCFTALPAVNGAAEEPPLSSQDGMPVLGDGHATCSNPAGISAYTLDGKCAQEMPSQVPMQRLAARCGHRDLFPWLL